MHTTHSNTQYKNESQCTVTWNEAIVEALDGISAICLACLSSHFISLFAQCSRSCIRWTSGFSEVQWRWTRRRRKRWLEDGLFLPERVGSRGTDGFDDVDGSTTTIPSVCRHAAGHFGSRRQRPTQPQGRPAPSDAAFLRGAVRTPPTRLHQSPQWQRTVHT